MSLFMQGYLNGLQPVVWIVNDIYKVHPSGWEGKQLLGFEDAKQG
jgi:hypothetical protein